MHVCKSFVFYKMSARKMQFNMFPTMGVWSFLDMCGSCLDQQLKVLRPLSRAPKHKVAAHAAMLPPVRSRWNREITIRIFTAHLQIKTNLSLSESTIMSPVTHLLSMFACLACHCSFLTGGEDGYVRLHHFDLDYFTTKFF